MNREHIVRELLVEGLDDWVPVDRLIGLVRESEDLRDEEFKEATAGILDHLLRQDLMAVGELGESGFEAWPGTVEENVTKVVATLDDVNWVPLGGACWLSNTARGDSEASG